MAATTRWAMSGTGLMLELIGPDFLITPGVELVALCSRDRERGRTRAAEFGLDVEVFTDFAEMCARPDLDVIYIATPHSEHFWQAKTALGAGKHVLVEKSMTLNAGEAEELAALAKAQGLFLMEAMWTRFNPLIAELKRRVADGLIGELRQVEAWFGGAVPFDINHRLFAAELGGGTLLDQGVYPTTFADVFLGGEIKRITARGGLAENGVEDHMTALIQYNDGRLAVLGSSLSVELGEEARLIGTDGTIEVAAAFWCSDTATLVRPNGDREVIHVPMTGHGYVHMLEAVHEAIASGESEHPLHPPQQTVRIMRVLDEMRAQIYANLVGD